MTEPNNEVDELQTLINELGDISYLAKTCRGDCSISNRALSAIDRKATRLMRSLNDTTRFSPAEYAARVEREQAEKKTQRMRRSTIQQTRPQS